MSNTGKFISITAIVVLLAVAIDLFLKYSKVKDRNLFLENDNHRLRKYLLERYDGPKTVVVSEIDMLIREFKSIGANKTVVSLVRAKELYSDGHQEEAIKKLVVIIENKLKGKLDEVKDSEYLSLSDKKKKFIGIKWLIDRAKTIKYFDDFEYSLAIAATQIRHGESHQEGFKEEEIKGEISFFGCVEIIRKFRPSLLIS